MGNQAYFYGVGRRKTAIARVKLSPGKGTIVVNGVPYQQRFPRLEHRRTILQPFLVTDSVGKFDAEVKVTGGGITGQSGAICHGIARALAEANESLRPTLRGKGLLTRDPRIKERKKPGLKRARKAPQYTKR